MDLTIERPVSNSPKLIKYRSVSKININVFKNDIAVSDLVLNPGKNSTDLHNQYHNTLTSLLDKHAPERTISCSSKPSTPWISPQILEAKRKRRQLERRWRRTRLTIDRSRYNAQVHFCNRLHTKAKNQWYSDLIDENQSNPKKLWNAIGTILHRTTSSVLPDCSTVQALANSFSEFFSDKISRIMLNFNSVNSIDETKPPKTPTTFSLFHQVTETEVKKIIKASPNKQCGLDPCPTWLVKECMDILIKPITSIVNFSLSEGFFPHEFKQAHVSPLIKKPSLQRNDYKNYRPVSGLSFISKVIEKVISSQIKKHMSDNGLENPFQSAYRHGHSTETTL